MCSVQRGSALAGTGTQTSRDRAVFSAALLLLLLHRLRLYLLIHFRVLRRPSCLLFAAA